MAYGILLMIVSFYMATRIGPGWEMLWAWPSLAFATPAGAYLSRYPVLLGKRSDGSMSVRAIVWFAPYLACTWLLWHLMRLVSRERAWDELCEGVFVGRRLLPHEMPPGIRTVVDLTSELPEPAAIRRAVTYVSVPILDGTAPSPGDLAYWTQSMAHRERPLYIHCAQGHGRTGTVAAVLLVILGIAGTAEEAFDLLRRKRPGMRLNRGQREAVRLAVREVLERPVDFAGLKAVP